MNFRYFKCSCFLLTSRISCAWSIEKYHFCVTVQGKWVLPALKQLLQIAKVIAKNSCHKAEKVNTHLCNQDLI